MARKPESTPVQKHAASLAPYPMHGMTLVPEQLAKLNSELDLVHMNANVMSGILLENVPGSENPDDMQLLQKLHTTCREMQERISLLLLHLDQDNLTDHLLRANDDLNRIFVRYERFQRSRTRFQRMETKAETAKVSAVDPSAPCSSQDLISFTEMDPPAAPVFAAHFSSHVTDPQNGYFAVGNVNDGVPNVPSPTLSTLQPESILCHTDSGLEPLYSNVAPRRSAVLLAPTCSEFPGSPHDSLTWGHISELAMPGPRTESDCRNGRAPATSQSESSKMVGTHLIGLEFDPLVNGNYSSEPIYEELDMVTKP
ncbi:TOM1-like protein 1 isoform X2 [Narcine bancroftii]|uniref:TOM1-like protein 1 isoform X2 n=2 Tax=Narcine bancroftii TaxID=1343680 RepID=UPI003831E6A5